MSLRSAILLMSGLGVISDSILIAFYPQFFEARYGITSSIHVGSYIAAISIAVMCTLPFWARVALKVETMHLLLYTQLAAGLLGLASAFAGSIEMYWVLTMLMFMTKASYLLMFPYLMRLEPAENHAHVVGLLSVIIHIAAIFAATFGGFSLQYFGPQTCVALMALGDFAQMAICFYLIKSNKVKPTINIPEANVLLEEAESEKTTSESPKRSSRVLFALIKLSIIMLLFDFSAFLARPFFSIYWENTSEIFSRPLTGAIFAIPGIVALFGLWANRLSRQGVFPKLDNTFINLLIGAAGLALQAIPDISCIVIGRILFGWGLFQVVVRLEVTLFEISTPEYYARDFSITNFFQNLGVLLSSFAAGYLFSWLGVSQTFALAAIGFLLTAAISVFSFGFLHKKVVKKEIENAL